MFCLVRTDPEAKQQSGISFLLIDMKKSRRERGPIALLDGGSREVKIFPGQLRVPVANLVGEENRGWTYAKFLLGHERSSIAAVGSAEPSWCA